MSILYDAGLLVAAERDDRAVWADHRFRLELGIVPVTTAPVVAQVSRSPGQAQLRRLLRGCQLVASRPSTPTRWVPCWPGLGPPTSSTPMSS